MKELNNNRETIEQKQFAVNDWIKNISEQQKVTEMDRQTLMVVLESFGANFESLSDEENKVLGMYNEKKRNIGMEKVWGEKWGNYQSWVSDYAEKYQQETGEKLPGMVNVPDLKNEEREASGDITKGMKSFLGDITGYASGNLSWENFKLLMEARAENGALGKLPKDQREGKKKKIIEWDREIDPEKGPLTKEDRPSRIYIGKNIPEDKQEIKPASFRPGFPTEAWKWISTN